MIDCAAIGQLSTVEILLVAGCKVNPVDLDVTKETPLDLALAANHITVIELLVRYGGQTFSTLLKQSAILIQKCFRGYIVRKKHPLTKLFTHLHIKRANAAFKIQRAYRKYRNNVKREEKSGAKTEMVENKLQIHYDNNMTLEISMTEDEMMVLLF